MNSSWNLFIVIGLFKSYFGEPASSTSNNSINWALAPDAVKPSFAYCKNEYKSGVICPFLMLSCNSSWPFSKSNIKFLLSKYLISTLLLTASL